MSEVQVEFIRLGATQSNLERLNQNIVLDLFAVETDVDPTLGCMDDRVPKQRAGRVDAVHEVHELVVCPGGP